MPTFSHAFCRLGNRTPRAAIDAEIITAAALLGAVLVLGVTTAADLAALFRLDAGEPNDLGPLLGFVGNELGEFGGGCRERRAAECGQA